MRRQDSDGGAEILCHVMDLVHQEAELPRECVDPGADLLAAHGAESVGELLDGVQEVPQANHRTRADALLRGTEQDLGDIAGGTGLDNLPEQLLHGLLGDGLWAVEPGRGVGP
ncbi:hypothetical protein [Streptomyces fildesensis]|uniref:hypothetical protein n=1 Tax=Streptomyces fildesensis TaxID=375757 RepID=UPI0027B944E3|nr:hypothetical protein [Streptomyces fildesensis]